jgi:endonuclease III-like uncharacterized protein
VISLTLIYNLIYDEHFFNLSYGINEDNSDSIIINLQRSGGFIYSPINYTIESNMLSNEESKKLNDLISNSNFYNLKNESLLSTKGADMYVYKITIENKGKSQSLVNITDLSIPKELNDLISFVMDFHNK